MAFNPNEHMMKLKGKDYLQVAWRLVWFREDHPDWGINAECIEQDQEHAIFKAVICDENGIQKSSGHGSESKRDFGDYLEKAETKAIGRALAMLGYGTQFAADELDEGERIVDSPINRTRKEEPVTDKLEKTPEQADKEMARRATIEVLEREYNIGNKEFGDLYRAYCKEVLKANSTIIISSLTDEQFDNMVLAINDKLKKGAA
jgi:hypothetical protein